MMFSSDLTKICINSYTSAEYKGLKSSQTSLAVTQNSPHNLSSTSALTEPSTDTFTHQYPEKIFDLANSHN